MDKKPEDAVNKLLAQLQDAVDALTDLHYRVIVLETVCASLLPYRAPDGPTAAIYELQQRIAETKKSLPSTFDLSSSSLEDAIDRIIEEKGFRL